MRFDLFSMVILVMIGAVCISAVAFFGVYDVARLFLSVHKGAQPLEDDVLEN